MKPNRNLLMALLCAFVIAAVFIAPALYAAEESTTVTGSVMAVKNAKGKVTSMSIQTDQGEKYMVATKKGKGKEFMKLADKKVEATGMVKESKGRKIITISEYKVLESETK
jgi:hypothetical protein